MSSSVGMMTFPTEWKNKSFSKHFQTTNQLKMVYTPQMDPNGYLIGENYDNPMDL